MYNTLNYMATTNAPGTFNVSSDGYVQGSYLDDPAVRYQLAGGYLAPTEVMPMWGGVGINETTTPNGPQGSSPAMQLGGAITRATTLAAGVGGLTGFSVFNQNYAAPIAAGQPIPLTPPYGQVNFFRLRSRARVIVACDPSLVELEQGPINQPVSWDFGAQRLVPYVAAYPANALTAASWANTNGGQATFTTTSAHGIAVGDDFVISGVTPSGYNGYYTALSGTTGSTLVAALATNPGAGTGFGTLVAGGGALPVNVLNIDIGNSMTINFDPVLGGSWNYSGSVAVIEI